MRRFFGLMSALSLIISPAWAGTACNPKTPELFNSRSQSNLNNLFKHIACSAVSEDVSVDDLDFNYCSAVNECQGVEKSYEVLTVGQKKFIEDEALIFLMRENSQIEIANYNSYIPDQCRYLLSSVEKMSEKYQKLINKPKLDEDVKTNVCFDNSIESGFAQQFIKDFFYKKTTARSSNLSNIKSEYKSRSQVISSLADISGNAADEKKQDFQTFYSSTIQSEKKNSDITKKISVHYDSEQDEVLGGIYTEVVKHNPNVMQISKNDLIKIITESMANLPVVQKDYILNFDENSAAIIKKFINEANFSQRDFNLQTKEDRQRLSDKINVIRVKLANRYFQNECHNVNFSISQVCSGLTKKLQTGHSLDVLSKSEEKPFDRIIKYYKDSKIPDKDEKIAKLENVSKSAAYRKYLLFSFQKQACGHKFKNSRKIDNDDLSMKKNLDAVKAATEASRVETVAALAEAAKQNDSFNREIISRGIKLNPDFSKTDLITTGISIQSTKSENVITEHDDFTSSSKNNLPSEIINQNAKNPRVFDSSITDSINNYNAVDTVKKMEQPSDYESKLRSKLAEFESREKAISQKLAQASSESHDADKSLAADELKDLRRQIDELKQAQNKPSATKAGDVASMDAQANTTPSLNSHSSFNNRNANVFGAISQSGEIDDHSDVNGAKAAMAPSNNVQPTEFSNPGGANIATRAFSPVGSTASGQKANREKAVSGIILTKSGEVMQDPASILDNPKEGDIVNLLEVTNGQPFLIRENGVLMKVTVELDESGRPKLFKGKPRYKKEPLTKAQQETIIKEANIPKSMKEIDHVPTRLFNLKSLINETVKRD